MNQAWHLTILATTIFWIGSGKLSADDSVEFIQGATMKGTVKSIRKAEKEFDFEALVGGRTIVRTYPFSKVHAVTYRGNRFVLTPRPSESRSKTNNAEHLVRSKTEIERLLDDAGSNLPNWYATTKLDYPPTLDLNWPMKPEGPWNSRKNMGQFIWDIVNPNPSKWRSGIKLVHHCLELHEGDQALTQRDQATLGRMYFDLLQDYPRAAYWFRRAGVKKGERAGVMLAECYFRLGNRPMAMQSLISRTYNAGAAASAVKLYGNMGELPLAIQMHDRIANTNASYEGSIALGDALRQAGKFDQAIRHYNQVLQNNQFRNKDYERRYKARAKESIEAIQLFEKVDVSSISDGTYTGSSTGYNGQLDVMVEVLGGRIESVNVTQHREKQFYSALTDTAAEILSRQSVRGVDGTTGATITSRAIVNASAKALSGASP